MADTEEKKTKLQIMDKYLMLVDKDTTSYDEASKATHEKILAYLAKQLFS